MSAAGAATATGTVRVPGPAEFTVEHFRAWASKLVLDNGEMWTVEPYFESFLADYFTGVPECWLIMPEANAKTTSLAGLAVYLLEHRPCASIPWAASARDQAEIGHRQAAGFVRRSPRLRAKMKVLDGYRRIVNTETDGRIQVLAADADTGDGIIPTDAFLDELHRHKDMRLYRTWQGKIGKRGAQLAAISTAGAPGSEFEDTRESIRQGTKVIERRSGFLHCRSEDVVLHEWAVQEGADVEDMAVVKQANPFSGITPELLAKKRRTPTMTLEHWRRFTCNLPTREGSAAINEAEWDGAGVDEETWPDGETVWVGLDVGRKYDTTAAVPLWWRDNEFRLFGPCEVLVPPMNGEMMQIGLIKRALERLNLRNPIDTVVMDMHRAEDVGDWLESELGVTVVDRGQGLSYLADDYEKFTAALANGWLHHTRDPVLRQHVFNATAKHLPKGDYRFDRQSSSRWGPSQSRRVIDALQAAAMVHSARAIVAGSPVRKPARIVSW